MLFLLFFPSLISWSFLGPWRSASQCWLWYRVSPVYSWRPGYFHSCHSYLWFNIQYRLVPFLILFFPVFAEPSKVLHIGGISFSHPGGEQPREIARPPSLAASAACHPAPLKIFTLDPPNQLGLIQAASSWVILLELATHYQTSNTTFGDGRLISKCGKWSGWGGWRRKNTQRASIFNDFRSLNLIFDNCQLDSVRLPHNCMAGTQLTKNWL